MPMWYETTASSSEPKRSVAICEVARRSFERELRVEALVDRLALCDQARRRARPCPFSSALLISLVSATLRAQVDPHAEEVRRGRRDDLREARCGVRRAVRHHLRAARALQEDDRLERVRDRRPRASPPPRSPRATWPCARPRRRRRPGSSRRSRATCRGSPARQAPPRSRASRRAGRRRRPSSPIVPRGRSPRSRDRPGPSRPGRGPAREPRSRRRRPRPDPRMTARPLTASRSTRLQC